MNSKLSLSKLTRNLAKMNILQSPCKLHLDLMGTAFIKRVYVSHAVSLEDFYTLQEWANIFDSWVAPKYRRDAELRTPEGRFLIKGAFMNGDEVVFDSIKPINDL